MRAKRFEIGLLLTLTLLCGLAPAAAQDRSDAPDGVKAILELDRDFFYAGRPLFVRLSVGNDGQETVDNPVKAPLFDGFEVVGGDGKPLEATGKPSTAPPARPKSLTPKGFYGAVVDITEIFPRIREGGRFDIRWSADGVESATLTVRVIPEYDPAKDYRATIRTEEGPIVIEFFEDQSPIAVKAFVDMANAGAYDGLLFHEVRPDELITGGSPAASGVDRRVITFPAEPSTVPVVAGTVLLRPVSAAPPSNSSPFMIVLRPRPEWTGQATVLGQVVSGLETARSLSRRPSTAQSRKPFFRPLKDIRIETITVEEKSPPPAAPAS